MHYKNNFKNSIAILLMITILLSFLPVGAFADTADITTKTPQQLAQETTAEIVKYYASKSSLTSWDGFSWDQLGGLKGAGEDLQSEKWKKKLPLWKSEDLTDKSQETDYAAKILGSLAKGENPKNLWNGRNVVSELQNKQNKEGSFGLSNSHVWAMIALDAASGEYDVDKALNHLIAQQKADGGFNFFGQDGDADSTGMVLIALSNHQENKNVQTAIAKSLEFLKKDQLSSAGFRSWGTESSNTIATVISGLVAVGENIFTDKWQKNNKTMLDALFAFQLDDKTFMYTFPSKGEPKKSDSFATSQSFIALGDISNGDSVWKRLDKVNHSPGDTTPNNPSEKPNDDKDNPLGDRVNVHLRIEGIKSNILDKDINAQPTKGKVTALDVIKKALDAEKISYKIPTNQYGAYIQNIQGESAGKFGGYDGWMYLVSGKPSNVGIGEQVINEGDEIIVYYGMFAPDTLVPIVDISPSSPQKGDNLEITVSSNYFDWNSNKDVNVKVTGATVTFNNQEYTTDDSGTVTIQAKDMNYGEKYFLKVSKDVQDSYPRIVRTGEIPVVYTNKTDSTGGNDNTDPNVKKVSLYVKGDKGVILTTKQVELRKNDTPFSILERELPGQVQFSGSGSSIYVRGINGLFEFDKGPESGWMFAVNGDFIQGSASNYELENGDSVEWLYTLNMGKDVGDKNTSGSPGTIVDPVKPGEVVKPSAEVQKAVSDKVKFTTKSILAQDNISDWSLFALVRNNEKIPEKYIDSLKDTLKNNKGEFRKITDLERTVLLARSLGLNPLNIEGINLIEKVYNHSNLEKQGVNGVIFALIALDSGNYDIPAGSKWTRDNLTTTILTYQHSDGSFSLAKNGESDLDITAMAVQALANYKNQETAQKAIDKALNYLATNTKSENCENVAQIIIALTSLGITPEDSRFIKDDKTLLTRLLSFAREDGSFSHVKGGARDEIATEQALTALVAYERYLKGQNKVYFLSNDKLEPKPEKPEVPSGGYSDEAEISNWAFNSVLKAKEYQLMNGTDLVKNTFEGKRNITRAEFVSLLLNLLDKKENQKVISTQNNINKQNNTIKQNNTFNKVYKDVKPGDWHYTAVMTAREKGLVVGVSPDEFASQKPISREEMAAILVRALKLDTSFDNDNTEASIIKDNLQISDWAKDSVLTVFKEKIIVGDNGYFSPKKPTTREMAAAIAVRLYEKK
ncbi:S-layer homology domain-containing protein [Desulfonispora thiosulfatigenes DSM 11270]|uniref:S-layer homology domain-containing protein n=1 Tax=Desulfonispora thiosulfatigenes DSM 11270 TaxID=656914 RepID=A0A1W1UP90_DESTI|nr:DUF4430 domain-containing protein [Desulfonispora thiosulfatigenes]SMB82945.1 S-layer homology domain-containing protein [Desulfonispora thiosulfatigenes DSM 11270]